MPNQTTKQKIDSARDILVGKIPDPKQQVDQITTALIYKFMDDMDKEAQELGGKIKFFTSELNEFAWHKLLDKRLSGQERIDLYVRAISTFSTAKQLPQLFRDIFKDAFLPYRDPETLTLFLKDIDEFTYDNSENLGNAFEYLLSILGSQGEAGQFRTPRHIIDFIVEVVDPQKDQTILDPACGTAGFLISAYKHILHDHDRLDNKTDKPTNKEKQLTPDERKKMMNNFVGYDISPDMVKLSLVNMYLHGFQEPKIYEYDTLSSEKRWGERFDVIMANPPFMTPKGGIRPHKRFSVQAKRSEVLFVDYILEHLNLKGRAGIIVPEGIIFKTDNAYKKLRQMLVEDGLFAVVSLPSGVFNPYAGVKTSILFFDNELAKKTDEILFLNIENDGFGLGAQRRPTEKNDLPKALEVLHAWKKSTKKASDLALWVKKENISKSGDYNLTGKRYKEVEIYNNQKWPIVELGEICTFEYGKPLKQENRTGGKYPVFGSNGVVGFHNKYLVKGPFIIIGRKGTAGAVVYSTKDGFPIDTTFYIQLLDKDKISLKYLYHLLRKLDLGKLNIQAGVPGLNRNDAYKVKIPLPPLEVQKGIITEIIGYQKIIDGASQMIDNWKPNINIDPEWKKVKIGEVTKLMTGGTPLTSKKEYYGGKIKWLVSGDINQGEIFDCKGRITNLALKESNARLLPVNSVLIALNGQGKTRGTVAILRTEAACNQSLVSINPEREKLIPEFLLYLLKGKYQEIRDINGDNQRGGLNMSIIRSIEIPLPAFKIQEQIVAELEKEEEIVNANRHMIELMETKIKKVLSDI